MKTPILILLLKIIFDYANSHFIELTPNGYKGIKVSFSDVTPPPNISDFLQRTQNIFTSASKNLHHSTRKKAAFEEVTFILPRSWDSNGWSNLVDQQPRTEFALELSANAEFVIIPKGLFGRNPFTIQHRRCKFSGIRTYLPYEFITKSESDENNEITGKRLVHEWAHYRYGVFDEQGFSDDPLYPLYRFMDQQRESIEVTNCADKKVNYITRNINGEECTLSPSPESGNPTDSDCFLISPDDTTISSTLMDLSVLSSASDFCDDEKFPHNDNSPNKQNTLCQHKSTWSVISDNSDFKNKSIIPEVKPPTFKFLQESTVSIVLALDSTTDPDNKIDEVKSAVKKFLMFDVPPWNEIGIVSYSDASQTVLDLTTMTENNLLEILENVPRNKDVSEPHPFEAVINCIQVLEKRNDGSGIIILVTRVEISKSNAQILKENLIAKKIRLFIIWYPSHKESSGVMDQLSAQTTGKLFSIPKQFRKDEKKHSSMSLLYDAFSLSTKGFSWQHSLPVKIKQQVVMENDFNMEFFVDEGIANISILIYGSEVELGTPITRSSFHVFHNGEEVLLTLGIYNRDKTLKAHQLQFSNAPGHWYITFHKEETATPVIITVYGFKNPDTEVIDVNIWPTVEDLKIDAVRDPFLLYVEVRQGIFPVAGAKVTAIIHHPDLLVSEIELFDNGIGDPDITKNDGIYSRYITSFSTPGIYFLTVQVDDNNGQSFVVQEDTSSALPDSHKRCCGSFIPPGDKIHTGNFSRILMYGSFLVTNIPRDNMYFPSRITDFRIVGYDNEKRWLNLTWSSPGGEFDQEIADHYEIRISRSRSDLLNDFDNSGSLVHEFQIHGPFPQPENYGTHQAVIVDLNTVESGMIYIGIVASNIAGNKGLPSNIVSLRLQDFKTTQEPSTVSEELSSTITTTTAEDDQDQTSSLSVGEIIGIVIGFIALLIIIGAFVFVIVYKKRKERSNERKARFKPLPNPHIIHNVPPEYASIVKKPIIFSDDDERTNPKQVRPNREFPDSSTSNEDSSNYSHLGAQNNNLSSSDTKINFLSSCFPKSQGDDPRTHSISDSRLDRRNISEGRRLNTEV